MDFDDSFEDGFDDGEFMDDSDGDFGSEDSFDEDSEIKNEPTGDDICEDEFTVEDAVMTGIAFGWGYEEGKRRKLERKMDDDQDQSNNDSKT